MAEFNGDEHKSINSTRKVAKVNINSKSCDNCRYSFIKANGSVQCYNLYVDLFSRSTHSPCDFWNKKK